MGLQEVVRQMPDAVVIVEAPSGRLLLANNRARAFAARRRGRAEPALSNEELELFYSHGHYCEKGEWPILRSARHGVEIVDEEYFQLAADGTRIWLRVSCSPVRDAHGRIIAAVAVARDITEQKRVEAELRYHASLVANTEDAVIATDDRFVVTAWNSAAERLYGRVADEVLGRHITDVVQTELSDAERADRFRLIREEGRSRIELVAYRKDGAPVDVESVNVALRDEHGEVTGYLGIHRDVSDRKRSERALREQRVVELETYAPTTHTWVEVRMYPSKDWLSVSSHDISERKAARQEMTRRAEQQALVAELGQRALASDDLQSLMDEAVSLVARTLGVELAGVAEIAPGDGEEVILRAGVGWREGVVGGRVERGGRDSQMGYALLRGEPVIGEGQAADRRFKPSALAAAHGVLSALSVMIASPDEPFGVLGALSTSRREFSQSEVSFVQAVANVLASAVERSRAQARLSEVREAERRRIARDLHHEALRELTDALVLAGGAGSPSDEPDAASRLAALIPALRRVGQQLRGAIYDLRVGGDEDRPFPELVEALVDVHRAMALDCEVELEVRDGVPTGPMGATGTEILRVLGEALTNARRHSSARHVRVRVWGCERRLCAEVYDDGRGFDPAGRSPAVNGNGIKGMRERAGLIHGELDIRSEPGAGTSVRIEVLLTDDGEEPAEQVRVLLVEDHASVRQAIASAFEREADFKVVGEAASLAEAREMLDDVDVAVLDLGLPDGYGPDLIKELRKVNRRAQGLVLSATLDRAEIARAVQSGAAGVLNKTADLDEVVDAVRRLRAGETLLPMDEIVELLRFAGRQREREHDERQALAELTPREREILQALAEGLDSQRMADRLHISIRTARNHINNILAKLGVHSQLQALVLALRYDMVKIRKGRIPPTN